MPIQSTNNQETGESEYEDIYLYQVGDHSETYLVKANNTPVEVLIDSGAKVNLLDEASYNSMSPKPTIQPYT